MSPEAKVFFDIVRAAPKQIDLPLAKRREAGEHAEDATVEPVSVRVAPAPALGGGFWIEPTDIEPQCVIVYLFGGGYVLGSPASRRKTAGHLARAARARVLVADYRLAPEHPYPAALDDASRAYRHAVQNAGSMPVFIAGDSAGGGLALALGLYARDKHLASPAGIVALSPWADLACAGGTMATHAERDIECTRAGLLQMAGDYLGAVDPRMPYASPVYGDFRGVAPILCLVGSEEVLVDDTLRVARAVADAGGSSTVSIWSGMQHVFPIWVGAFPEAGRAMALIGTWIGSAAEEASSRSVSVVDTDGGVQKRPTGQLGR